MTTITAQDVDQPTAAGVPHYEMFIDGKWVDADERYAIIDPATEELVATAAKGGIEHADAAVAA